jgi:hypothetical protein
MRIGKRRPAARVVNWADLLSKALLCMERTIGQTGAESDA